MAHIGTRFFTWRNGRKVGEDSFGNCYYEDRKGSGRRWVVYKGLVEGSKVPPQWNAWLHRTTDAVPESDKPQRAWEKPHLPNLTGTPFAWRPRGHVTRGGKRAPATGDYEAWSPES
ncbi:MAG: NADH:ubiquinone oxidoreductase subunit NDUFA12 [Pseudomonadota bacterium]|nr:NADH:ubiquinone oxidoreductase subunit NDUFA12 [Pseudomonadota bacterium]